MRVGILFGWVVGCGFVELNVVLVFGNAVKM